MYEQTCSFFNFFRYLALLSLENVQFCIQTFAVFDTFNSVCVCKSVHCFHVLKRSCNCLYLQTSFHSSLTSPLVHLNWEFTPMTVPRPPVNIVLPCSVFLSVFKVIFVTLATVRFSVAFGVEPQPS